MTSLWMTIVILMLVQAADAFSPRWRWREDDGDVFLAAWKDSMNCPVTYQGEGNIRLRKGYIVLSQSPAIKLCYSRDPYASTHDTMKWTPITSADTGMFFLSDSRYLEDGARYSNNMMLSNWDSVNGAPYRGTITIDTSSLCHLPGGDYDGYELEYSLRPNMSKIPGGSAYYFLTSGEYNPDPACIRIPPLYWSYHKEKQGNTNRIRFLDELNGWYQLNDGNGVSLWRTTDGGRTWAMMTNQFTEPFCFTSRDTGWAVVNGRFSKSTDGGATWRPLDNKADTISSVPNAMCFCDAQHGWLSCQYDPMMKTSDGGTTWERIGSPPERMSAIYFANERVGFIMGENLYKTTDGGVSWRLMLTGYKLNDIDAVPSAVHAVRSVEAKLSPRSFSGGWIQFADSSEGWVQGYGGKIFHTTDGGEHWTRSISLSEANTLEFYFSEGGKAWAVGALGSILATKDRGKTWEQRPSGIGRHLVSIAGVKDHIWIGCDDGTILSSESGGWLTTIEGKAREKIPEGFMLSQNYPNPFNPSTTIRYMLPRPSHVRLRIYDMLGREVGTLIDEAKPAGVYEAFWNASRYSSGVYLIRLTAGDFVQARVMALVK